MRRLNVILVVILAILLIVTLIEVVVIYRYSLQPATAPSAKTSSTAQEPSPGPLEIPSDTALARERSVTRMFEDLKKGYISDAILSTYYKGKLIGYETITSNEDKRYDNGLKISLLLNIKEVDSINNIIIPAGSLKTVTVVKLQNGQEVPASLKDMQKDDTIVVKQDFRIIETDPVKGIVGFKITIQK